MRIYIYIYINIQICIYIFVFVFVFSFLVLFAPSHVAVSPADVPKTTERGQTQAPTRWKSGPTRFLKIEVFLCLILPWIPKHCLRGYEKKKTLNPQTLPRTVLGSIGNWCFCSFISKLPSTFESVFLISENCTIFGMNQLFLRILRNLPATKFLVRLNHR